MQNFITRKNIEQFEKKLAATTDEAERQVLLKLLAEEKAKAEALREKTLQGSATP